MTHAGMAEASGLSTVDSAAPIGAGERILALDVLRGVAVLGILLMNITAFGLPWPAYVDPTILGGSTGASLWAWITTQMLFEGTMRTIFSMLFGAGVIVFTTRAEKKDPTTSADLYYRRTILLIFFGVIHGYLLLWVGDVLYAYGMAGLFLFPLRKVSGRGLVILGLVVLMVSGTISAVVGQQEYFQTKASAEAAMAADASGAALTEDQEAEIEAWEELLDERKPSAEEVQKRVEEHRGGYLEVASKLAPINLYIETKDFYTLMFWDVISMMLIGMGLVKWGVVTAARSSGTYAAMMVVGYGVGLAVNAYEVRLIMGADFGLEGFLQAEWTYNIGRLFVAMGHIGVVMLVVRLGVLRGLQGILSAVGRMALTNYLSQSILCNFFFLGVGFGMFGELSRAELYIVVGAVWVAQMIWSPLWLAWFRFGPVEWVWRWLTYGRMPRMRRMGV